MIIASTSIRISIYLEKSPYSLNLYRGKITLSYLLIEEKVILFLFILKKLFDLRVNSSYSINYSIDFS